MTAKPILLLLLACSFVSSQAGAAIYKWVDEKGVTHYSESPPSSQKTQEVQTAPAAAPAGNAKSQQKELSPQEVEIDFRRRRLEAAEREQKQTDDANAAKRKIALRKEACIDARNYLEDLESHVPVYRLNERGERDYLEDKDRPASGAKAKKAIAENCDHQ
jgi:hypothetical protein